MLLTFGDAKARINKLQAAFNKEQVSRIDVLEGIEEGVATSKVEDLSFLSVKESDCKRLLEALTKLTTLRTLCLRILYSENNAKY